MVAYNGFHVNVTLSFFSTLFFLTYIIYFRFRRSVCRTWLSNVIFTLTSRFSLRFFKTVLYIRSMFLFRSMPDFMFYTLTLRFPTSLENCCTFLYLLFFRSMPDFETFHALVGQASFGDSSNQTGGGTFAGGGGVTADHDDELAAAVTGTLFRRGVSSQGGSEGDECCFENKKSLRNNQSLSGLLPEGNTRVLVFRHPNVRMPVYVLRGKSPVKCVYSLTMRERGEEARRRSAPVPISLKIPLSRFQSTKHGTAISGNPGSMHSHEQRQQNVLTLTLPCYVLGKTRDAQWWATRAARLRGRRRWVRSRRVARPGCYVFLAHGGWRRGQQRRRRGTCCTQVSSVGLPPPRPISVLLLWLVWWW